MRRGSGGQIALIQFVHFGICEAEIFAVPFPGRHRIFKKHIKVGVAGILCNRKDSCHICQLCVGGTFQQIAEKVYIGGLVAISYEITVHAIMVFPKRRGLVMQMFA